jgi:hypothetical protein
MHSRAYLVAVMTAVALGVLVVPFSATATHVRPKSATPKYDQFVIAYQPCGAGPLTHGLPANGAACAPIPTSTTLTTGTPDANAAPANMTGFQKLTVCCSNTDVQISFNDTDVRCLNAGSTAACTSANSIAGPDYGGTLLVLLTLRITDHYNGPIGGPYNQPGTTDFPFSYPVPCATSPPTVGSTCSAATTFNSLVPMIISNEVGKRANIQLRGTTQVFDGGPDADGNSTFDNTLYQEAGVFIP